MVKNPPLSAEDMRGMDSVPESGGSSGGGHEGTTSHSGILAWRIPWTEEPGGLESMGKQLGMYTHYREIHLPASYVQRQMQKVSISTVVLILLLLSTAYLKAESSIWFLHYIFKCSCA